MMTLYHVTSKKNARSILKRGFRDREGRFLTDKTHKGVWLSDRPLSDGMECPTDCAAVLEIVLELDEGELAAYEWIEKGKSYREWLIPAALIKERASLKLL